jgi:hypothetical protein
MPKETPPRVCLELFEENDVEDGVEEIVVGFRQAGELHELIEAKPPVRVTLERPAVWMKDEYDLES